MTIENSAPDDYQGLGRRAAKSSFWVTFGFASSIVLKLVSSVILTRFIHPEIYGLMDLVLTLIIAVHLFSDIGIIPCLIQSPRGGEPRHLNTVWTLQLIRNVLLLGVIAIIAVPISKLYHRPILAPLLPGIGVIGVLESLQSTGVFVLNRQVRRGRLVAMEIISAVVGLVATVAAVYLWNRPGFHAVMAGEVSSLPFDESLAWTIVVGNVMGKVAWVGVSYILAPAGPPRFDLDRETVREVFGFGRWVFFSTILQFLAQQTDRLIAPKVSDFQANGLYGRAMGLVGMGTGLIETLSASVIFPTISRAVERGTNTAEYAIRLGRLFRLLSAAVLTGLFVTAPSVVRVLYPEAYSDVGWIVQALAVAGWFQSQSTFTGYLMLGIGKPSALIAANGSKLIALLVLALPAAIIAQRLHFTGILALILVVCIGDLVRYASFCVVAARSKMWSPWTDIAAAVVATFVATVGLVGGHHLTLILLGREPHSKLDWIVSLLVHGGLVVAIYAAVAALLWRRGVLKIPSQ